MMILLKGIGIGIAIAAPVGPIGILCMRRTLADGRTAGLATGLGAATADGVYGLIVAVGFAATGILVSYADPMKAGGGLLLAFLGIISLRSFLSGPAPAGATETPPRKAIIPAFIGTFLLTLSNPMTILAFIGMLAALGSSASTSATDGYILVLGVFLGSALWWLFLVQLALFARKRLSATVTRWFDLASGLILLFWGLWIAVDGTHSLLA